MTLQFLPHPYFILNDSGAMNFHSGVKYALEEKLSEVRVKRKTYFSKEYTNPRHSPDVLCTGKYKASASDTEHGYSLVCRREYTFNWLNKSTGDES